MGAWTGAQAMVPRRQPDSAQHYGEGYWITRRRGGENSARRAGHFWPTDL